MVSTTVSTKLLQLLHGFYRGSDGILENGPQNKKLNFLVFCRNAGPPLPNKSCNHPCKSGARCTDRCIQSEEMCSKKDPPPKKLNFLRFLGPSQHIPPPCMQSWVGRRAMNKSVIDRTRIAVNIARWGKGANM